MSISKITKLLLLSSFSSSFKSVTFKYLLENESESSLLLYLKECSIKSKKSLLDIENSLVKNNIEFITYFDEAYPFNLRQIADPPSILYYKGNINLLGTAKVGISGSRKPSELGKRLLTDLIECLSEHDISVVSGGAIGLDSLSIKYLLNKKRKVIIIFPSSLISIYPKSNSFLFNKVLESGGLLISESLFDDVIHKGLFLKRNRLIAGMSDALVILQAGIKSGTLSCARYGIDYNKQVYCYIDNKYSEEFEGNNYLVKRNYADILLDENEIIEYLKAQKLIK